MPAISVLVDGALMARVRTDGLNILAVHVGGTKSGEAFATVVFSGGKYPNSGESVHLLWLNELALHPGQCVRIEVSEQGDTTYPGKTIEELFPDDLPIDKDQPMPSSREELVREARLRPHQREHFTLTLQSSSGCSTIAKVDTDEHGFGANFVWNWVHPERIRASLDTYSLEQLVSEDGPNYHFQECLYPDAWVEVKVDA
jgi:hypothetical protein